MSGIPSPPNPQGYGQPYQAPPYPYYPPPQNGRSAGGCVLAGSLLLNVIALVVVIIGCFGFFSSFGFRQGDPSVLAQLHHSGSTEGDSVAIVKLEGVIMEGLLDYTFKQIEQAADDPAVKAIVFRIDSPGGSITASDDLWRKLTALHDGDSGKSRPKKPIVVSMGSMAASGGYYVAMPSDYIFAERTTMTGSIGVYAAFPNIHKLGDEYGFKMETIKQGEIKDSGSPFKKMSDKERLVWQSGINEAYNQFVDVVIEGRTRKGKLVLTHKPLERFPFEPVTVEGKDTVEGQEKVPEEQMTRYIADGGIFSAQKALELKLIDGIGTLDRAIAKARTLAKLPKDSRVIQYKKPLTLTEALLGIETDSPNLLKKRLEKGLVPRLWYLAPGCELAGLLAAME